LCLFAIFVFSAVGRNLYVVIDDRKFAALILEGLSDGVEFALNLRNLLINLGDVRLDALQRTLCFRFKLLVFSTLFNFFFALAGVRFNFLQVAGVTADELLVREAKTLVTSSTFCQRPIKTSASTSLE